MIAFIPAELIDEFSQSLDPRRDMANYLSNVLHIPAVVTERGVEASRGRLDFRPMARDWRISWHEVH